MPTYLWKNIETDEVIEIDRPISEAHVPPDDSGVWTRRFSFGVGRVEGGGGSPARQSCSSPPST